ncbi:MAG: hypothetical protein Q9223_004941 [Gallowayella weberi]
MAAQEPHDEALPGNILLLDKSTQPLALQIREACKILGIQLPAAAETSHQQERSTRAGPREEWALRWLLKKLEHPEACLDLDLWSLFRELIPRLPLANLARLLRDHGFLAILLTTLSSFEERVDRTNEKRHKDAQSYTSGKLSDAAESTSSTLGTSVEHRRPSKKRKLDEPMISCNPSLPKKKPDFLASFLLVCNTLRQLQALGRDHSHGYAVEHLRMALKASPEQAAGLLGRSLNIIKYMLRIPNHGWVNVPDEFFQDLMNPWIEVWTVRSKRAGNASIEVRFFICHNAYSAHAYTDQMLFTAGCLTPALEVLTQLYGSTASKEDLDPAKRTLQALLLQHVIFPAKKSFELSKEVNPALDTETKSTDINELLAPLREHNFTSMYHIPSWLNHPHSDHPITRFYRIIMDHTPLTTAKQRIANRPWLQFMFEFLSEQGSVLSTASSQDSMLSQGSSLATKQMLSALAESGIKLETATLERALTHFSHILDESSNQIDWDIVGLCLKVDPDVFVVPDVPNLATHSVTRTPNKFLTALLTRLSLVTESSHVTSDANMAKILQDVLVPLVGGFARARDLNGFVNYLKSNLIQSDKTFTEPSTQPISTFSLESRSIAEDPHCIWEHEGLVKAVADQVEFHLTAGQIKTILQEANVALESARESSDPNSRSAFSANLVILDCILSGCTNENTISKLSMAALDTYMAMLGLCEAQGLPRNHRWRLWRCIATVKNRWGAEFDARSNVRLLERQAAAEAFQILSRVNPGDNTSEELHCFNFLLSVMEEADPLGHKELAESIIQLVLTLLDLHTQLLLREHSEIHIRPFGYTPESLKMVLASQKSTLLYASLLCNRTTALGTVDQEMQRHFIERVFECDLLDLGEEQALAYLGSYYESLAFYIKKMTTVSEANSDQRRNSGENEKEEDEYYEEEKVVELDMYSVAVIAASLDFYRRNADKLPVTLQQKLLGLPSLDELGAPVSKFLCDWINRGRADSEKPISDDCEAAIGESIVNVCRAAIAQEIMATYKESFTGRPLPQSTSEFMEDLIKKLSERSQITRPSSEVILALKHASHSLQKTQQLLATSYDAGPLEVYRQLAYKSGSIKDFGPENCVDLMTKLVNPENRDVLNQNDLLLLQSLITRYIKAKSQSPVDGSTTFSEIVNTLCDTLLQPQAFQVSILSLRCINLILHKLPRTITQFHIDQIMAVIAKSASRHPLPNNHTPKQAGLQYLAFCRVLSAILAFHRKRLGGRYHLMLPVLQSLLYPLFIPYKSISVPSVEIYTATCASAYSRILLQLADPSLSSVTDHSRKSRRHQTLNDATKIAKSIAGQHLHYLIMTYCDCQLKGRLTQEVREKLRPGLWAVLDVIPQEVMRVMNAGMDKAGRGVWKGLYQEWRRDGRDGGRGR